MRKNYTKEVL